MNFDDTCECDECKLEREAMSLWADFLAHAATNPLEMDVAADVAAEHKRWGVA